MFPAATHTFLKFNLNDICIILAFTYFHFQYLNFFKLSTNFTSVDYICISEKFS